MANPYPAVFRDDNSETRLAGLIDFTDTANQPGLLLSAAITLTDAQIRLLPTAPIEIVAAPGAGRFLVPLTAWLVSDTTAGAYTNYNTFSATSPFQSSVFLAWDALNFFNTATGPAPVEFWLSAAQRAAVSLSPVSSNIQEVGGDLAAESGLVYSPPVVVANGYEDVGLYVVAQNTAKGNFTDGDPANTLKVSLLYAVIS